MSASGGVSEADNYRMLLDSFHWAPSQLLEFQRLQLAQLLVHAKDNVPFYRTRLDCIFRSDGTIDWERRTDIPILTRSELRDKGKLLLADSFCGVVLSLYSSKEAGLLDFHLPSDTLHVICTRLPKPATKAGSPGICERN